MSGRPKRPRRKYCDGDTVGALTVISGHYISAGSAWAYTVLDEDHPLGRAYRTEAELDALASTASGTGS